MFKKLDTTTELPETTTFNEEDNFLKEIEEEDEEDEEPIQKANSSLSITSKSPEPSSQSSTE